MEKLVKTILTLLGLGVLAFFVSKEFKKIKKEDTEKEEEKRKELEKVGINADRYEVEMTEEEKSGEKRNLLKELYLSAESEWDVDFMYVDVDAVKSENTIHLRQQYDPWRRCETFDILLEIPKITQGNFNSPTIKDYMRAFKDVKTWILEGEGNEDWKGIDLRTKLEGYFILVAGNKLECCSIPPELHADFAKENTDGLADYVNYLKNEGFDEVDLSGYAIGKDDPKEVKVVDAKLMYKLSFKLDEVNVAMIKEIVEIIYDQLEIKRDSRIDFGSVRYDHVLFNTENERGYWSLLHCLDFSDEEKRIFTNSYVYKDWALSKGFIQNSKK